VRPQAGRSRWRARARPKAERAEPPGLAFVALKASEIPGKTNAKLPPMNKRTNKRPPRRFPETYIHMPIAGATRDDELQVAQLTGAADKYAGIAINTASAARRDTSSSSSSQARLGQKKRK